MIRFNTPSIRSINPPKAMLGIIAWILFTLFLASCSDNTSKTNTSGSKANGKHQASSAPAKKEGTYITAEPNPVPKGPENGSTLISWGIEGKPRVVHVYVATNNGEERLFAETEGASSVVAPWIADDLRYEFRLYSGSGADRKLLDKVVVTRQK